MKKVAQKTFQITTEIRENPFNKAQHDQLGGEQGGCSAPPDDDAADYDGALNRHHSHICRVCPQHVPLPSAAPSTQHPEEGHLLKPLAATATTGCRPFSCRGFILLRLFLAERRLQVKLLRLCD